MRAGWGAITRRGGVLAVLAVAAVSASPASATGTTLYVATTGADSGNCQTKTAPCKTIGYALGQAPSGATVDISAGTYDENPLIGGSVSLVGAAQSTTIIDGRGLNTTVDVTAPGGTVSLSQLTIRGGGAAQGGGIASDATALALTHVTVTGNTATPPSTATAGTPGQGGGIYLKGGTVTITSSKITANHATGSAGKAGAKNGGAPGTSGGDGMGGGIFDAGATLTLTSTVVEHNTARGGKGGAGGSWVSSTSGTGGNGGDGGTGAGGGIYTDDGPLTLDGATIDFNTAQAGGGGNGGSASPGVGGDGGGADGANQTSSDIEGGGGIYSGGSSFSGKTQSITITSSDVSSNTVVGGTAGSGGSGSASGGPGGVWSTCGNTRGGGIFDDYVNAGSFVTGNLTITSSTVNGNTLTGCNGGKGGGGQNGQQAQSGGAGGSGGDANGVWGGGVFYFTPAGETLKISNSSISGNTLTAGHGGDGGKGGNGGPVISGTGTGGGAGGDGAGADFAIGGGVFYGSSNYGTFAVTGSTISGNAAVAGAGGAGGAGGGGGAAGSPGAAGGNGGAGGGGGITNDGEGGGIAENTSGASIQISNSTIAQNSATGGAGGGGAGGGDGGAGMPNGNTGPSGAGQNGGDGEGGGLWSRDVTVLTNVTIAGNSATGGQFGTGSPNGSLGNGLGGGVYAGSLQLGNTLIATNTVSKGSTLGPDCNTNTGSAASFDDNLIGDGTGCSGPVNGLNGDQVGTSPTPIDPQLGSPASNGGPTQTMALMQISPAVGAGLGSTCTGSAVGNVDQRGYPRYASSTHACDIGAYDSAEPVSFTVSVPATATAGQSFSITVTAVDAFGKPLASYIGKVRFSSTDSAATLPKQYAFKAADAGTHTFKVTLASTGSQTVTVKDAVAKTVAGTSGSISVGP